jgi:hypothetical protein
VKHRIAAALVAAVVATHMATVTGTWYRIIDLPTLNWPVFNGILLLPEGSATSQFWAGSVYHYLTGICYGLIFAFLIHPLMRGIPNTVAGNLQKAGIFGAVLGTLSALLWVPRNFPQFDPGFFSNNLGWKTVVGIYVWHAVYALHLGALYSPLPEAAPATREAPAPASAQPV